MTPRPAHRPPRRPLRALPSALLLALCAFAVGCENKRGGDDKAPTPPAAKPNPLRPRPSYSWDRPADPSSTPEAHSSTPRAHSNTPEAYQHTPQSARNAPYDEGYANGYEAGREDGENGLAREYTYDASSRYRGAAASHYQAGYDDGYEEGYIEGHADYEDFHGD